MLMDCWDSDAEARLSAANVALRMEQFIATNINDLSCQDSNQAKAVVTAVPATVIDMIRRAEHSQSSPPPYYSPTDPIPFQQQQQQSDVSRQDSTITAATNASQSIPIVTERPTEHSQSGPPPYSEPAEDYVPFYQTQFQRNRGPILAQQKHQVSMPHIFSSEPDQGRAPRGHMAARCTHSLRSNYQYESEIKELETSNKSESLSLRNMATVARESINIEEDIRELSQSLCTTTVDERPLNVDNATNTDHIILGGHNRISGSSFNSDSGYLNAHSDLSRSDVTTSHYATESDQDQELLAEGGATVTSKEEGSLLLDSVLQIENSGNSESTVTSV